MSNRQPAEWNASVYHQVSNPHVKWGRSVLDDLSLQGNETVLDAGCGTGRLTAELLALVPNGQVIAIDRDTNMLTEARENLARFGKRVRFVRADVGKLTPEIIGTTVDLVFSTATFHWIADHRGLFDGLYRVLKPGGRLSAQCGGGPNLERLLARTQLLMDSPEYRSYFAGWPGPWEYATDIETANRLHDAGFIDIRTWLHQEPTQMENADAYHRFLTNVIFGEHLARIPEAQRTAFVERLTEEAATEEPSFFLDYWRLNIRAHRPVESKSSQE